jgi:hypothetical protein
VAEAPNDVKRCGAQCIREHFVIGALSERLFNEYDRSVKDFLKAV